LISAFTSTAGVSGAFALLPFQMSVLGYTAPGVSATNFVYNIIAIPMGAMKYMKEKRLSKAIVTLLILGTVPGVFLGYYIRVVYLPDPANFKIFVGCILAYLGIRSLQNGIKEYRKQKSGNQNIIKAAEFIIQNEQTGLRTTSISLKNGEVISFSTPALFIPAMLTGVIGGAYGIGGGAVMVPFCVAVLELPVYLVAGAALVATWVASVISVIIYAIGPITSTGIQTSPDWLLGILFGVGGLAGIYTGTKLQKIMAPAIIKMILGTAVLLVAAKYLIVLL
ncbi:MAG: sulfite exporter TauE/SafE family protein, partial [Thermodesulfobacteriota bacterium]|nr:sulfite exporter TauE/SafE family protein [Thermodesulfobacteriota bacterium]